MKTLEQLGVSPAPWIVTPNNLGSDDVTANDSTVVVAYEPPFEEDKDNINKRLIAAAPDLYDALYKITKEQECGLDCMKCKNHGCVIKECKTALAKASGESEVKE